MAPNSKTRQRRRNKGTKPTKSKCASRNEQQPARGPTSVHDIPDHLLELILRRLRTSACLLRAAAACKRWCRAITGTGFLSRCLHARSYIAGHYHAFDPDWVDHGAPPVTANPAFIPSPSSSSLGAAAVDARRFSLDAGGILPDSDSGWALADSRGSLLLLFKRPAGWTSCANSQTFHDLLVCEPLTRRRQGILRPDEYATCLGVFLLDGGHNSSIGMSDDFRVLAVLHVYHVLEEMEGRAMPAACVFSPGSGDTGGWRDLPSESTNSEAISIPGTMERLSFAGRANGSLHWVIEEDDGGVAVLVLDEAAMVFSRVPFPADAPDDGPNPSYDRWSFRVIGGGATRVVRMVRNELTVLVRRCGSGDGDEWVWEVERSVRLREATLGMPGREDRFFMRNAMMVAAQEAYVLVTPKEKTWLFSVEIGDTMRVECDSERNRYARQAFPSQLPWPPSLVSCTTDKRGRRRRRSCP
ncbi:unnamed protein product [Urochloa humidicola]